MCPCCHLGHFTGQDLIGLYLLKFKAEKRTREQVESKERENLLEETLALGTVIKYFCCRAVYQSSNE